MSSTYSLLGIPESLAIGFCLIALSIALIPFFGGTDVGPLKIPKLTLVAARRLRYFGPLLPVVAIALFLPVWTTATNAPDPQRGRPATPRPYVASFFNGQSPDIIGSPIPMNQYSSDQFRTVFGGTRWLGGPHWGIVSFDAEGRTGSYTNEGGGSAGRVIFQADGGSAPVLLGEWSQGDGQKGGLIVQIESSSALMDGPIKIKWGPGFTQESEWKKQK